MHRAVNTLDAMVGHHNQHYEHFGWASARLDDVVNYLPARLTTAGTMIVRPHRALAISRTVRRDAKQHPSPNGGVVEAAFAAALGIQLGGINRYGDDSVGHNGVEDRGLLGDGRPPAAGDIQAAVDLRRHATVAVLGLVWLCHIASWSAFARI